MSLTMKDIKETIERLEGLFDAYVQAKKAYEAWTDDDQNERTYKSARDAVSIYLLGACLDKRAAPRLSALITAFKELEAELEMTRSQIDKTRRALTGKDEAMGVLFARLHSAGVDVSDLIP